MGLPGPSWAPCTPVSMCERSGRWPALSPLGYDHSRDWTLQKSSDHFCWVSELVKMHNLLSPSKEQLEHGRCSPVGLPQPDLLHKNTGSSSSRKTPGQSAGTPGLKPAPLGMGDVHGRGRTDSRKTRQVCTNLHTNVRACVHTYAQKTIDSHGALGPRRRTYKRYKCSQE